MQDYIPLGVNQCQGRNFTDSEALVTTDGIGSKYTKARYIAYTDATFTKVQVGCRLQWAARYREMLEI